MTEEKGNLEQRTQTANDEKIPKQLSGKCPGCKKEDAIFYYKGQQNSRIAPPQYLYNCRKCEHTFTLNSLINKHGATYKQTDMIDPRSIKPSLLESAKKSLIKLLYSF